MESNNGGIPAPEAPVGDAAPAAPATPAAPVVPSAPEATASANHRPVYGAVIAVAIVSALLFGTAAGLAGGYLAYRTLPSGGAGGTGTIEVVGDTTDEPAAAAAAAAIPSVVNIRVTTGEARTDGLPSDHPDIESTGEGSGVAYKSAEDGGTYIITNDHVTTGATAIVVTDSDGEEHEATLVGGDPESDIAVVKVTTELPTIQLGDSESLVVGQLVVAIGSPFGLQQSVSSGIISATHRPLTSFGGATDGTYPFVDSIQTDASINPGNSGGALVDRQGKLIGIPSAILSDTGVADGVGLAIPIAKAAAAADELIETGVVQTPFLGVLGQDVTARLAEEESLGVERGAYIVEVMPDTEAEKAGVKAGDVVVAIDDAPIRGMDELILAVRRQSVGDQVTLRLWRDGAETTLRMTIGVKPTGQTE